MVAAVSLCIEGCGKKDAAKGNAKFIHPAPTSTPPTPEQVVPDSTHAVLTSDVSAIQQPTNVDSSSSGAAVVAAESPKEVDSSPNVQVAPEPAPVDVSRVARTRDIQVHDPVAETN